MLSSVGLEVMNSTNPELSWKSVTKGRRSKKSVARSLNSVVKAEDSIIPKRVGDISGSDSDKFGEMVPGQATTGKSENVPLKKRRYLLQSASPNPWASSLHIQDSTPSRTRSSPLLEDHGQLKYPSCSSGDFSGIELLAAAASMDDDIIDADKKDILPHDSSIQKNFDASSSARVSEQCLKIDLVNSLSNIDVVGGNVEENNCTASQSLSTSLDDDTMPKIRREHWDLNTLMDAWGEPYDNTIAGDSLKDVHEGRHVADMEKHFGDNVLSNPTDKTYEPSGLDGEVKSTSVPEDGIRNEPPHHKENLQELPNSIYPRIGGDTSSLSREKDSDDSNSIQALGSDSVMDVTHVANSGVIVGESPLGMLCSTSGLLVTKEENNAISGTAAIVNDGDSSSNVSECEKIALIGMDEVKPHDTAASESAINIQLKDADISKETSTLPGTFTLDAQPVASTDSNKQIDGAFLSNSTMANCEQYPKLAEPDTKHVKDDNLPKAESKRTMVEASCKSFSAGTQCDKPTTVGRIGLALDSRHDSDFSQDKNIDMVDGDDLTGFQEGYDSPYEDGELRGSFLYSWEDNEIENERVDYESDGRNGDGSDADCYNGSEIVEGGSEGSHGTQRSRSLKLSVDGKNSVPAKHSLKKHVVKAESDNNELAGKASNAGSGSTVEQCMEMAVDENDGTKRVHMLDHKDALNVRVTHMDEYASNAIKGKLQSRVEGRSSADGTGGKFFMQQSRPRRISNAGSYQRPERGVSPDRYIGRYKSAAPGERDGVQQWTSWGNRRRYTTNYQVGEGRNNPRPRNKNGEVANKIDGGDYHEPRQNNYSTNYQGGEGRNNTRPRNKNGDVANKTDGADYHEPRQNNYLSRGMHRPLMRRSPVERDDYFGGVDRRVQLTRGRGNYRGRGHYSQRPGPGRNFTEDFEPVHEVAGPPVRMQRYLSRRERSFSPGSGRQTHMPLPRRRSRSRSRTRSPPRAWHPPRERIMGARRLSRSPDFRSEPRMERMRMPFSKSNFASDYGEGCISPSRGRFSPQRNCRWVDERNFNDNQIRRRRSPVRVFKRNQRFDAVGSSGRFKSDEYNFSPTVRPGRFSFMPNGGNRECKVESNYDDRRRDDSSEMTQRLIHPDDAGNMRRFRQNTGGWGEYFESKYVNNEEDNRDSEVAETQQEGEREDKQQQQQQVFKI